MQMPVIEQEFAVFLHAVLNGIFGFALYSTLKVMRKLIPHKNVVIQMEDFCYWVFMGGYLFVQIYHTNNGKIRWYSILGLVVGCIFFWKTFLVLKKIWKKIYVFVDKKKGKSP